MVLLLLLIVGGCCWYRRRAQARRRAALAGEGERVPRLLVPQPVGGGGATPSSAAPAVQCVHRVVGQVAAPTAFQCFTFADAPPGGRAAEALPEEVALLPARGAMAVLDRGGAGARVLRAWAAEQIASVTAEVDEAEDGDLDMLTIALKDGSCVKFETEDSADILRMWAEQSGGPGTNPAVLPLAGVTAGFTVSVGAPLAPRRSPMDGQRVMV